jgi:hypothetical protein
MQSFYRRGETGIVLNKKLVYNLRPKVREESACSASSSGRGCTDWSHPQHVQHDPS